MKIGEIISYLEEVAPPLLQESYDNVGLLTGSRDTEVSGALLCLDVNHEVLDEAIACGEKLVIAHHPFIFSGIKKLTGSNLTEQLLIRAVKNDIAIYASHTNMDSIVGGLNTKLAEKLGMSSVSVLKPVKDYLLKLVCFVPSDHLLALQQAIFDAGAGVIGKYDMCSFNAAGKGSFRAGEGTDPFVGEKGELHLEEEIRLETIFPRHIKSRLIAAMKKAHPYEEVAYDIYTLENDYEMAGMGMIGELEQPMDELKFLDHIKKVLEVKMIKHTALLEKTVKRVALCGGSGSFLLKDAIRQKADVFVSADFTYHKFFDAENKILIADVGHYESEQVVKEVFYEILKKKFPTFAARISELNTNPINYY